MRDPGFLVSPGTNRGCTQSRTDIERGVVRTPDVDCRHRGFVLAEVLPDKLPALGSTGRGSQGPNSLSRYYLAIHASEEVRMFEPRWDSWLSTPIIEVLGHGNREFAPLLVAANDQLAFRRKAYSTMLDWQRDRT